VTATDLSPALTQALAGGALAETRATPAAAFARALDTFRRGQRIDMAALAADLGVARTTLYRWTGDRDQLITDVLWSDTKLVLDALAAETPPSGAPSVQMIGAGFLDVLAASHAIRAFLHNEGQRALLLLTVPSSTYRTRLMAVVIERIELDIEHGYRAPETPELLADSLISITERFLHNGGEPKANPSPEMAKRAIALLLRE
jgi:AcrR family transcriptional regulator